MGDQITSTRLTIPDKVAARLGLPTEIREDMKPCILEKVGRGFEYRQQDPSSDALVSYMNWTDRISVTIYKDKTLECVLSGIGNLNRSARDKKQASANKKAAAFLRMLTECAEGPATEMKESMEEAGLSDKFPPGVSDKIASYAGRRRKTRRRRSKAGKRKHTRKGVSSK